MFRSFLAFSVVLALTLGACGPSTPTTTATSPTPATASQTPTRGGTLVFAIWQEPTTVASIYQNQTVSGVVGDVVVEGLLRTDTDGNYQPLLAKAVPTVTNGGVKVSADGKRMDVTYDLLSGVKWSDGDPFTSADVKFTWETIMKDPKVITREGYDQIESIDTPSDTQVVMHYKTLYGPYLTRFALGMLPKHVLQNVADISTSDFNRRPMGTGPFKITEFVAGDHITAERNPNFRVSGQPYLDKIIFRSVPSREVAVAQLKAGEVDGMWNLLEAQIPDLEKDQTIRVVKTPSPSVERIEMNMNKPGNPGDRTAPHPVLSDINVRHALVLATPKQAIIDKLLFGLARPGSSPVSQGWASPKGLAQESYDTKKANDLLDQAGWVKGSDGIRSKGGVRASLTISTTTGDAVRERVEQILIDEWKAIGIELAIKNQPSAVFLSGSWSAGDPRKLGNFDVAMYASSPAIDPHQTISLRYTTKNIPTVTNQQGQNYTGFSNKDVDVLVDDAGNTLDLEKRKSDYAQALKLLNDSYPIIWMYDRLGLDAFRSSVSGFAGNVWGNITTSSATWSKN
jgi:peptide/nickel transport system substrate-binding protein